MSNKLRGQTALRSDLEYSALVVLAAQARGAVKIAAADGQARRAIASIASSAEGP
jgi:hypothetical protein